MLFAPLKPALLALLVGSLTACGGIAISASEREPGALDAGTVRPAPSPPPSENAFDAGSIVSLFDAGPPYHPEPSPPPPDLWCSPFPGCDSPSSCPEGNGCTVCTCTPNLQWLCPMALVCTTGLPPPPPSLDAGVCPAERPTLESPCYAPTNVVCDYGCEAAVGCMNGQWNLVGPMCSPPPPGGK